MGYEVGGGEGRGGEGGMSGGGEVEGRVVYEVGGGGYMRWGVMVGYEEGRRGWDEVGRGGTGRI